LLHTYCCGYESEIYSEKDGTLRRAGILVSFVQRILNARSELHITTSGALKLIVPTRDVVVCSYLSGNILCSQI
jgi:hypothetical protein